MALALAGDLTEISCKATIIFPQGILLGTAVFPHPALFTLATWSIGVMLGF